MEGFNCTPGQGISLELAIAFMQKVVNLPFYEIEGMVLRVKDVDVQKQLFIPKPMSRNSILVHPKG